MQTRRKSTPVKIGGVWVGGDAPVVVQSMTNTDTEDAASHGAAGRRTCCRGIGTGAHHGQYPCRRRAPFPRSWRVWGPGIQVPIIGDFHYNGHRLLSEYPECARALAKYRINPGNVGAGRRHDENFRQHDRCCHRERQARAHRRELGIAGPGAAGPAHGRKPAAPRAEGSAREVMIEAMVQSALESAQLAEDLRAGAQPHRPQRQGLRGSGPDRWSTAMLAARCDYAIHLGLTEAGMGAKRHRRLDGGNGGASAGRHRGHHTGFADSRTRMGIAPEEVLVAQQILQSLEHAQLHAAGFRLSRLRPHHLRFLPGTRGSGRDPICGAGCRHGRRGTAGWRS